MSIHWHACMGCYRLLPLISRINVCPTGWMTHCGYIYLSKTWMKYTVTPLGIEKHSIVISTHRTQVGTYLSSVCWPWGPPHWWPPLPLRWGPESSSHQTARTTHAAAHWFTASLYQLTILADTYVYSYDMHLCSFQPLCMHFFIVHQLFAPLRLTRQGSAVILFTQCDIGLPTDDQLYACACHVTSSDHWSTVATPMSLSIVTLNGHFAVYTRRLQGA